MRDDDSKPGRRKRGGAKRALAGAARKKPATARRRAKAPVKAAKARPAPSPRKPKRAARDARPAPPVAAAASPAPAEEGRTAGDGARFPIVGIGASAGGLEALELFLRHAPAKSGVAFVVIQHLDPTHKGMLVELLQR